MKIKNKLRCIFAIMTVILTLMLTVVSASATKQIPGDSYAVPLTVNGRNVLSGEVFNFEGNTYVPMKKFADWLGNFTYSFDSSTKTLTLKGENLKVVARAEDMYICANDRYFYTVGEVKYVDGEIYVPIRPMTKALNCYVEWDSASSRFIVRSGDTSRLATAGQVYNSGDIYWLSRIISAEAKGESMKGKIAVGNVVINRMRSSDFPNSIYGVIFDKKYGIQFTPVANNTIYNEPTSESIIAAKMCIEGYSLSNEVLYFLNPAISSSSWIQRSRPYAFTVGNHKFYK